MADVVEFDLADGTRERVWEGSPRYRELLADGHLPDSVVPANDGVSDKLQEYMARVFDTGTMAYAENTTNVPTAFAALTAIPGLVIAIPATERDVWIHWGAFLSNTGSTTNAAGPLYTLMYELTGGVAVAKGSDFTHKDLGLNYVTTAFGKHKGERKVGPADHPRVFALFAQAVKEAGTTLSGTVSNSPLAPTWISAVAK